MKVPKNNEHAKRRNGVLCPLQPIETSIKLNKYEKTEQ